MTLSRYGVTVKRSVWRRHLSLFRKSVAERSRFPPESSPQIYTYRVPYKRLRGSRCDIFRRLGMWRLLGAGSLYVYFSLRGGWQKSTDAYEAYRLRRIAEHQQDGPRRLIKPEWRLRGRKAGGPSGTGGLYTALQQTRMSFSFAFPSGYRLLNRFLAKKNK